MPEDLQNRHAGSRSDAERDEPIDRSFTSVLTRTTTPRSPGASCDSGRE
jgi:hypothetical protein